MSTLHNSQNSLYMCNSFHCPILLFCFLLLCGPALSQSSSATCNFFEEQDGLLVIEMENLPLTEHWEVAQTVTGYAGSGYIQWTGNQYFNQVGRGPINFQIKINTPGTYSFNWRVAVGNGTESTEHNDSWLKINGDNFYAKQGGVHTFSRLKPKPQCTTDSDYGCPNGSSTAGFFKVFGGNVNSFEWKAKTSDHDAHDIAARFDTVGVYSIEINARSSFQCLDRLVLWHVMEQRWVDALKLSNPESTCLTSLTKTIEQTKQAFNFTISPNPASAHFTIEFDDWADRRVIVRDYLGKAMGTFNTQQQDLSVNTTALPAGIYFIEVWEKSRRVVKRVLLQ